MEQECLEAQWEYEDDEFERERERGVGGIISKSREEPSRKFRGESSRNLVPFDPNVVCGN